MALLESAMAFAVVMMIFSTIVTGIVEVILGIVGTREKSLQNTVDALFQHVVWPRLGAGLDRVRPFEAPATRDTLLSKSVAWIPRGTASALQAHQQRIVRDLTENPVFQQEKRVVTKLLSGHKNRIDSLSLLSFAERLGRTDVGKAIVAEGEEQMELLVQDMVRGFDRFGRAASEVFRKKAQLTAICVVIPFALIANIDASRLLSQLIENPEIRSKLIDQADEANRENEEAVARLKAVQEGLAELPESPRTMDRKASGEGDADDTSGEAQLAELQSELAAVSDSVRDSVRKMEAVGLDIGWRLYPVCAEGHDDPRCRGRVFLKEESGEAVAIRTILLTPDFGVWFVMATLAGVLIGLGGPFWFKVFTGLAQVFQVLRALGVGGRKPKEGEEPEPTLAAEESARPKDVLDAFKVAVAVNLGAAQIRRGRALLNPSGQPL